MANKVEKIYTYFVSESHYYYLEKFKNIVPISGIVMRVKKYDEDIKQFKHNTDFAIKILPTFKLNEILANERLSTKEKLLEILKNKSLDECDSSVDAKFDFLRDKDSIVLPYLQFKLIANGYHEKINNGNMTVEDAERETINLINDAIDIVDKRIAELENVEQEEESIDFSKTNKRVMKM